MDNINFWECECKDKYTIEPHGNGHALFFGRCKHKHGYNLVYLTEPAANCNLKYLEKLLNLGHKQMKGEI